MDKSENKINFRKIFACVSVLSIYLGVVPRGSFDNNLIYAIGEIHSYNNSVFNSNVFMADGVVSPRWMLDAVFAFFMKLNGGSWQNIAVPYIYLGIIVLCIATFLIGYRISEQYGHLLAILLAYFVVTCTESQVGGFNLREMNSIGMGMGKAFAILAIAYAIGKNKRFDLSWIFVAIATVMHIHEGVYGFAIVFILCLFESFKEGFSLKKNWSILVSVLVILSSVVPNMMTDGLNISNEEFVYIYATYRHPHHLVPSTWDKSSIILSFTIILFPFFLSVIKEIEEKAETKTIILNIAEKIVFIFMWVAVLAIMFVGTEKLNIVSITTLFCTKLLKYIGLVAMLSYLKIIGEFLQEGRLTGAMLTAVFAIIAPHVELAMAILFYTAIFLYIYLSIKYEKKQAYENDLVVKMAYLLIITVVIVKYGKISDLFLLITGMIFLIIVGEMIFEYSPKQILKSIMVIMTLFMMVCGLYEDLFEMSNGTLSIKYPTEFLIDVCGSDIYELANNFHEKTDDGAQFLANPDDGSSAGWFQVIAERNCYILYKVIPSSKAMMKEWFNRYEMVKGILDKSTDEIANIMGNIGIEYLLVDGAHYTAIEDSGDFEVFAECGGDTYRIYKLN